MKVAILGGTGKLGKGLAVRWSKGHDVILGSRSKDKAVSVSWGYSRIAEEAYGSKMKGTIAGYENAEAVRDAEVVVLAISHQHITKFAESLKSSLSPDAVIISPVVPLERKKGSFRYVGVCIYDQPMSVTKVVSAAEAISLKLSTKNIVSALHAVPATKLADPNAKLGYDVPMCSDNMNAVKKVGSLISELGDMRPLYAGPLTNSNHLESVVALLLNISHFSKVKDPSIRIV